MKASELRPLDVLKNTVTGELGLVVEIAGDKVCLADKAGEKAFYKPGELYIRISREEGGAFTLAALAVLRERRRKDNPRRKVIREVPRRKTVHARKR